MQTGSFLSALIIAVVATRLNGTESLNSTNAVLKYEEPATLHGTVLSADRTQTLFNFSRRAARIGNRLEIQRDYTYPDGKLAARERVVYERDKLVSLSLEETQTGGGGRVTVKQAADPQGKSKLVFEYSKDGRATSKRSEAIRPNLIMNDMLAPFLLDHWAALIRGDEIKCRFIVIPRKETVGFKFRVESQQTISGQELVIIKMTPTNPIISALVDPVYLTAQKNGKHRVLEYSGRTTPKIKSGDKWLDLDAVTVFAW